MLCAPGASVPITALVLEGLGESDRRGWIPEPQREYALRNF